MDQTERKLALDDPDAESPVATTRFLMAILHSAFVAENEVAKRHGHWWDPVMRDSWWAVPGSPVDGVDAGILGLTEDLCGKTSGTTPSQGGERNYVPLVRATQERELAAWQEFDECCPVAKSSIEKTIVDSLRR